MTISGSIAALPEWTLSETPRTEISGGGPPFLGSVGEAAFFGEDGLLVNDRQASVLRSFGADGRTRRIMASAGDGPAEIRSVTQLSVTPGDSVYAFDGRHSRFLVFGPDGEFVSTLPVDPEFAGPESRVRSAWALGSDRFVLYGYVLAPGELSMAPTELPTRVQREGVFQIFSADGVASASGVRFPGESIVQWVGGGRSGSPFWNPPIVAVHGHRIVYGTGLAYELMVRDLDLQPVMGIRWLDQQEPLTPSRLRAVRGPMSASIPELRAAAPEAADRVIDALFDPANLPAALPALGSVLLDEAGRMWVSRFRLSEDIRFAMTGGYVQWNEEDVWHVLDTDGTPIARVRLPAETRLLAVLSDRVLVVARDSLDVETVRVLEIQSGR